MKNIYKISPSIIVNLSLMAFLCFMLISCSEKKDAHEQIPKLTEAKPVSIETIAKSVLGQTLYVPIYSHLPYTGAKKILPLRAILSIRNTSEKHEIIISRIDYYDTNGKLLRNYLSQPMSLGKLASYDVEIPSLDLAGGTGANFIVRWDATQKTSTPIIEALMYGSAVHESYSFLVQGKEISTE